MKTLIQTALKAGAFALFIATATQAWGQAQMQVALFKVVTVKDDVIIGFNTEDLKALGGPEKSAAGSIASALADRKSLTVWQYSVRKANNGDSQFAPLRQIGLLAHDSLRVEPYSTPFAVLPHE
jgi:hypothetical protein